jgi:hypothetical protein
MPRIADTLSRSGSDWRAYDPPLAEDRIADADRRIGTALPAGLLELYRVCNGGEGSLPYQPWIFVLWGIDEVADLREHEHFRKYYDQFVFFGGNGGGEYFGLDPAGRVFFIDPIAGEESIVVVAPSFDEFAMNIGAEPPGGIPGISEA